MEKSFKRRCTPAVSKHWLWLFAGLLWSGVGIMLCVMAAYWLSGAEWPSSGVWAAAGFGMGILIYLFGFSRIARKNIDRIAQQPDRVCLFAFQAWRSYFLILFMMLLGYTLRHSPVPRVMVALVYSAIGTALAMSSSLYYERFVG